MPPNRKYVPLVRYLTALPEEQHTVRFSFAELEALLAAPLPASATLQAYWSGSGVARYNWELIGFRARLDRVHRTITFTRATTDAS